MNSRSKAWAGNGVLLLVALVLGVGLTELALRLLSPQPTALSFQDRYGLGMHWPGLVRKMGQPPITVAINSVGMRDGEHPIEKPPGVYRILVLGDSFMEAAQVNFEDALPSLLGGPLGAATGKRVEVLTAGVSGWGTGDELRYLTQYGLHYAPDLVLVAMTLHNDVSDNLREEWYTLKADTLKERNPEMIPATRYRVLTGKAFLAAHSHTYQLLRRVTRRDDMRGVARALNLHIVELFRTPSPEQLVRGYRLTDLLLTRMDSVTRAHGSRMALVLLPLLVQLSDSSFSEFVNEAGVTAAEMPAERPQQLMLATGARLGVPVIDLLGPFRQWTTERQPPLYLQNDGHWNVAGHKLAAEVVASGLLKAGVVQ